MCNIIDNVLRLIMFIMIELLNMAPGRRKRIMAQVITKSISKTVSPNQSNDSVSTVNDPSTNAVVIRNSSSVPECSIPNGSLDGEGILFFC